MVDLVVMMNKKVVISPINTIKLFVKFISLGMLRKK
jgi:hypothetical protein